MELILTTTNGVEGYVIAEYLGCVSGTGSYLPGGAIGEGYLSKTQNAMFSSAYQDALLQMRSSLKKKADAIIGIQTSICSMNGIAAYILVTVTGTAVRLEKILEPLPVTESSKQKAEAARQAAEAEKQIEAATQEVEAAFQRGLETGVFTPVDRGQFLLHLKGLDSVGDMLEEIRKARETDPSLFPQDFADKLKDNLELSRLYGKRVGVQNLLKQVEQFFNGT